MAMADPRLPRLPGGQARQLAFKTLFRRNIDTRF